MIAKSLIPALAIFALTACGDETPAPEASTPAASPSASYKVQVTFTPRTQEKLRELGEKVTVANMFFGIANEATIAAGKVEGDGQVALGEVLRDITPQNQIVTIAEPTLDPAKLAQTEGKPMLLINVYSARQKAPDNLLGCGIFDDTLEKAEAATIEIECDLLEPEVIEHAPVVAPTDEN
jgi:hypothetical protein